MSLGCNCVVFAGGSTRSTEIDRFEVDESSSKGETMVEVMKRMKEQFKAKEQEKAERQRQQQHNHSRYNVRPRARPGVTASGNSRNDLATNSHAGSRVKFADERVWNRGNNIAYKARTGTHKQFRGSSMTGESDLDADEDDEERGENDEAESDESGKVNSHNSRMRKQRFENRLNHSEHGNRIDEEDQYSFAGTAGRRIDQAVMEALQISRGH